MTKIISPYLTIKQAADYLNRPEETLKYWVKKKLVAYYKLRGRIRFKISDLDEIMEKSRVEPVRIPNAILKKLMR